MKHTKDARPIEAPEGTIPVEVAATQCGLRPHTLVHMIRRNGLRDPVGGELRDGSYVVYPDTIRYRLPLSGQGVAQMATGDVKR